MRCLITALRDLYRPRPRPIPLPPPTLPEPLFHARHFLIHGVRPGDTLGELLRGTLRAQQLGAFVDEAEAQDWIKRMLAYWCWWSDEDQAYIVRSRTFPGVSVFGDTAEAAQRELHMVLGAVLAVADDDEVLRV
jgi:predicted RNase H-like HicB family nuclease